MGKGATIPNRPWLRAEPTESVGQVPGLSIDVAEAEPNREVKPRQEALSGKDGNCERDLGHGRVIGGGRPFAGGDDGGGVRHDRRVEGVQKTWRPTLKTLGVMAFATVARGRAIGSGAVEARRRR